MKNKIKSENTNKNDYSQHPLFHKLLPTKHSLFSDLAEGKAKFLPTVNNKRLNTSNNTIINKNKDSNRNEKNSLLIGIIGLPAYYWVLISQLFVISPLLPYLPIWLLIFVFLSIIMQLPKIKSKFRRNNNKKFLTSVYRIIQYSAFFLGIIGLWLSYGGFNVEAGIAFLLLCLGSKLWEMYQKRDALVVLNLSFFVAASLFLLDKGFVSALLVLMAVLAVLMALIAINDDVDDDISSSNRALNSNVTESSVMGSGRIRSLILLTSLSVPLLIVLFLFFPRLPPLWTLQLSSGMSKTGVSDSMSPGDFSQLSKSTELAFRVEYDGEIPALSDMYWRGLVFSNFDGVTWNQNKASIDYWQYGQKIPEWLDINSQQQRSVESETASERQEDKSSYKIILEPTNNNWLYALDYPFENKTSISLTSNYTLSSYEPLIEQLSYNTSYKTGLTIDYHLTEIQKENNLSLPENGNEQAHKLAQDLFIQSNSVDDYIKKITNWINKSAFYYTLSPPKLGANRIDDFLFKTKSGFCEHYASSFVFLMRSAGIPARVVVGYQGGTLGRDGVSWEIRQMDAHAWTEVWIKDKGWVRVDPTAFVAPERIEKGMSTMTEQSGASMFGDGLGGELSYQQFQMLQDIRRFSDQMSYYWQKNIVGYDDEAQSNKLFKWFNIKSLYKQILVMILLAVSILSGIVFWLWFRQRQKWHPADKGVVQLAKILAKNNPDLIKKDNEGHLAWLQKLQENYHFSHYDTDIEEIKYSYRTLRYGPLSSKQNEQSAEYKRELQQLNYLLTSFKKKVNK